LPPGPKSPVGVVWIALSKPHYGIHGTPNPSLIGKTQSHGCIRLTNWDAEELAGMVQPGTPAILKRTEEMSAKLKTGATLVLFLVLLPAASGRDRKLSEVKPPAVIPGDYDILISRDLAIPVQGVRVSELRDTFEQGRGGHPHEALDIPAA